MGCSPWGCKESDTTEQLSMSRISSCMVYTAVYMCNNDLIFLIPIVHNKTYSMGYKAQDPSRKELVHTN